MSEFKGTPGPWLAFNMVNADGSAMNPDEIAAYVKGCVKNGDPSRFLFISRGGDSDPDICHVGNGPDGPWNAQLIAAAPELLQALQEVVAISDRKHEAWDRAHAAIAKALNTDTKGAPE